MIDLDKLLDDVSERVRMLADTCVSEERMIHPSIIGMRGDEEIIVVMLAHHIRDEILAVTRTLVGGLALDAVAIANDGYQPTTPVNPRTGKLWRPGEMQDVVEHFDGIENGWIQETLVSECADRSGELRMLVQPYRRRARRVKWKPTQRPIMVEGTMPNALRQIMRETPFDPDWTDGDPADPGGWEANEKRDITDAIVVELLHNVVDAAIMMPAEPGSPRARRLTEIFARSDLDATIVPPMFTHN